MTAPDGWVDRAKALEAEVRRLRAQMARSHSTTPAETGSDSGPIFVGGTGRSGTWAVGRLLGQDPDIVTIRTELRFHASQGGFRNVLEGTEPLQDFADRIKETCYGQRGASGSIKGLVLLATRYELNRATQDLLRHADGDLPAALATYMHQLVDPYALGRGATRWAETTPDNASQVDVLHRVFPGSRVIHVVRDGRDVAASTISMPWGPSGWDEALEWWENRIRAAHSAAMDADAARLLTIRLEDLVLLERNKSFDAILDLVPVTTPERLRRFFDAKMSADAGHVGRWRKDVDHDDRVRIDEQYRHSYEKMASDGVSCLPIHPDVADDLSR